MPQDPRTVVRTSQRLWSDEVAAAESGNDGAYQAGHGGPAALARALDQLQPVIYEFYGGRDRFRRPKDPYA